jgi:hypothetical protein
MYSALVYGDVRIENKKEKDLFAYGGRTRRISFIFEVQSQPGAKKRKAAPQGAMLMLSNYPSAPESLFRPYEAAVWYCPKE